ncbi:MAG: argininosuccinate lyase [Actinomycetota bacterium]
MNLWGGRFNSLPSDSLFALSRSIHFDWRLARYDIASSLAHLASLVAAKVVLEEDAKIISRALKEISQGIASGEILPELDDEDVHSALERLLKERVGQMGGSLRAGRSRNDQIVTDLKLFLLVEMREIALKVGSLARTILDRADQCVDLIAPGFTHIQHAQPVSFGQELAKHAFALERDLSRISNWAARTDLSPLGSGALAGSSLVPNPEKAAAMLGFSGVVGNSIDAVSERDFVAEALFILSMISIHLSRIGEEFTLYTSQEFGWVLLADEYSTGSSIMPQKKNPDVAELARGKAGRAIGNLTGLLTVLKGLPFSYNRDLQEDKEPIFDSLETLNLLLPAIDGMIGTATFVKEKIEMASSQGFVLATEIADFLAMRGVPFSEGHEVAGKVVKHCEKNALELSSLSKTDLAAIDPRLTEELMPLLNVRGAVESRRSSLGTSPASVEKANRMLLAQIEEFEAKARHELERLSKVLEL